MASPNLNLRDPPIYRIKRDVVHPMTGDKWKVYPMYDYAHSVTDALEGSPTRSARSSSRTTARSTIL